MCEQVNATKRSGKLCLGMEGTENMETEWGIWSSPGEDSGKRSCLYCILKNEENYPLIPVRREEQRDRGGRHGIAEDLAALWGTQRALETRMTDGQGSCMPG